MGNHFPKTPVSELDYRWDWSEWLADGEVITDHTITTPTGLTLLLDTATSTTVTAWFSGGILGKDYSVSCFIQTNNTPTRKESRTIVLRCG